QVDADVEQPRLDRLGHGSVTRARDDREADLQALAALRTYAIRPGRPTRLIEHLIRLVRREAIQILGARIVTKGGPHQRTPRHLVEALKHRLVQSLAIDGVLHRLAHGRIADWSATRRVEQQHEPGARLALGD